MEADRGSGSDAAGEHQPRIHEVEDGESSEAATPTVTMAGGEAELGTADDNASGSRSESRASSPGRSSSLSVWEVGTGGYFDVGPSPDVSPSREPPPANLQNLDSSRSRRSSRGLGDSEYRSVGNPRRTGEPSPTRTRRIRHQNHHFLSRSRSSSRSRWRRERPYPPVRDYSPASTSTGCSSSPGEWGLYDIDSDGEDSDESKGPGETLPQEWTQPRTVLEDGTATELIVAQSIEHRVYKSASEEIVLVSPSRPPLSSSGAQKAEKSRAQFRWLHVQPNTPLTHDPEYVGQLLERLVLGCPFISARVRAAALRFLGSFANKWANLEFPREQRLASTTRQHQFLTLGLHRVLHFDSIGVDRWETRTLLRWRHAYDVGNERELSQVARKLGVVGGRGVLHVAKLWYLSLGPGVLITLCCLPSANIRGDLIKIDDRAGHGFYTVQVKLYESEVCYNIVIDLDCSYVDFLQHAVAVATSGTRVQDATRYDLLYEAHNVTSKDDARNLDRLERLTPATWLELLGSDRGPENSMFYLKQKFRDRSRSRRPYHRRRSPRLSMRNSYREPPVRVRTRAPPSALIPYADSKNTDREQSRKENALIVWKGDQRGINIVDSATRPEPAFVRNIPGYQSGSEDEGEVLPRSRPVRSVAPDMRGPETGRPVEVRRGAADTYSDDDDLWVTERKRTIHLGFRSVAPLYRGRPRRRSRRGSDSNSDDTPAADPGTPPLGASGTSTAAPFFTWRVNSDKDVVGGVRNNRTRTRTEPGTHNLFHILRKIHESLKSDIREVYLKAYQCTEESLLERHRELARETFPGVPTAAADSGISPPAQGEGAGQEKETGQEKRAQPTVTGDARPPAAPQPTSVQATDTEEDSGTARQQKGGPSDMGNPQVPAAPQAGAPDRHPPGRSTAVEMANPADVLSKHLLELSQALIRRFVPKDEHSMYHPVCERFWGSVDMAIRQIRWSTEQPGVLWIIRDFGSTAKMPYAGCTACSRATKYSSASEALQHLHAEHFECPFGASAVAQAQAWPHDDPCYAYMKSAADTHSVEPEIENIAKEFIGHLSDFMCGLNRIQWLVARNSQGSAQRRRLGPNHVHQPPRARAPPLPRSLVYAFDELVAYYILQAKRLSLQNRGIGLGMRNNAEQESLDALDRSARMALRCRDIRGNVLGYLQQAHRDVILAGSGRAGPDDDDGHDADTALGVHAFDSTSLVRVMLVSALYTSFSAPLAQKKGAAAAARVGSSKARLHVAGPQDPAWDMVGMYSQYNKHLHEQAARRPRRRLFLDIHAVEDELDAFSFLLTEDLDWINGTLEEFPERDQVGADGGRLAGAQGNEWKRRYREERTMEAERHCLLRRRDAIQAKLNEVEKLKRSASALRERVRQLIEVMDEDHGKAIRVFTIVTVLFLPMTFVSGFFGMNTVDIRDTGATQSLYWTIAIPVTVVVLAIALVYGYRGEEIGDWIQDRIIRPRIATWLPSRTQAAEPSTTDGFHVKWDGTDAGVKEVWKAVRNSVPHRKRRTDKDVRRASTFQSDVLT